MVPIFNTRSGLTPKKAGDQTHDIAAGAQVVVVTGFAVQGAELFFHFVGGLPGTDDDLAHPAHGLAVRGDDGKSTQVVQNIFRRDGLLANAAFGKGHVLGDVGVQMMADH